MRVYLPQTQKDGILHRIETKKENPFQKKKKKAKTEKIKEDTTIREPTNLRNVYYYYYM